MARWLTLISRIILVLAALVVIGLGALVVREFLRDALRTRNAVDLVNLDDDAPDLREVLRYGEPKVTPQGRLVFPLYLEQDYRVSSYGKTTRDNSVNYLVMEPDDSVSWLFDGHGQLILSDRRIFRPIGKDADDRKLVAVLMEVVSADTNNDGRLSHDDRRSLLVFSAEFDVRAELLDGYSALSQPKDLDEDHIRFFATLPDGQVLYDLDLTKREFSRVRRLPDPSNAAKARNTGPLED